MAFQAQDTFVGEIDGTPVYVQRGQIFADNHPVVAIDCGRGHLFKQVEMDAPKRGRGRPRKNPLPANGDNGDSGGTGDENGDENGEVG